MQTRRYWSLTIFISTCLLSPVASAQECPGLGEIMLNEIKYSPKGDSFIELWGTPGGSLSCFRLLPINGGADGADCKNEAAFQFEQDHIIGADGYFVLTHEEETWSDVVTSKANLQDGPDGLQLQVTNTGQVLDSLTYGGPLEACDTPVMEGTSPAPAHGETSSIGRVYDHQDTNNNGFDWGLCPTPTPGETNSCPPPPDCSAGPTDNLVISEVRLGPGGSEFVELRGQVGLELGCYTLRTRNGGGANDQCDIDEEVSLVGQILDAGGFFVTYFDLQKGPDALELVYGYNDGTEEVLEAVVWKEAMPQCGGTIGGLAPVSVPSDDNSFSRCYDFGSPAKDFVVTFPTPGESNFCPAPCTGPTTNLVINEVVIDPNEVAFVELKGEPGLDLSCYAIREFNSGQEQDQCELETDLPLDGLVVPDDGYLVMGAGDVASLDLEQKWAAQNGPGDGFRLIYEGDEGDLVIDTFSWGATLAACVDPPSTDSGFGPIVKDGNSISRCPDGRDTNSNNVDLFEAEGATPGGPNACPDLEALAVCDQPPTSAMVINEIQTSPAAAAFIELRGAPGTAMGCYSLIAYNGGQNADRCEIYQRIEMPGAAIGNSGYFTIAPEGGEWSSSANFLDSAADLQDGPDALALIFTSTSGEVILMDAVVYGGELALCEDFNEGSPTEKVGKDRSITRCAGADTNNNESDFTLCSVPSPGDVTTCNCGYVDPTGGTVEVEEPTGCQTAHRNALGLLWLLLFGGAAFARRSWN